SQSHINQALFVVLFEIDVFVLVDRIEIPELVEPSYRKLVITLVIDIAFIDQHFAAQHVVAGERVAGKFQPAQSELLALVDGDDKVSNAFARFRRIVFEGRINVRRVLDKSRIAVSLLQILIEAFAQRFAVGDFALLQTDKSLNHVFREDRVPFNLHLADAKQLAVNDWDRDAQSVVNRRQERQWQNWKPGTLLAE